MDTIQNWIASNLQVSPLSRFWLVYALNNNNIGIVHGFSGFKVIPNSSDQCIFNKVFICLTCLKPCLIHVNSTALLSCLIRIRESGKIDLNISVSDVTFQCTHLVYIRVAQLLHDPNIRFVESIYLGTFLLETLLLDITRTPFLPSWCKFVMNLKKRAVRSMRNQRIHGKLR